MLQHFEGKIKRTYFTVSAFVVRRTCTRIAVDSIVALPSINAGVADTFIDILAN